MFRKTVNKRVDERLNQIIDMLVTPLSQKVRDVIANLFRPPDA